MPLDSNLGLASQSKALVWNGLTRTFGTPNGPIGSTGLTDHVGYTCYTGPVSTYE